MIDLIANTFDHSKAKGSAFTVRLVLANYANEKLEAWPSIETIARKARVTERAVYSALKTLEALGEVEVKTHGSNFKHRSNLYTLKFLQGENNSGADLKANVPRPKLERSARRKKKAHTLEEHPDISTKDLIDEWNRNPNLCQFNVHDLQEDLRQRMLQHTHSHPQREWWREKFFSVLEKSGAFKSDKWTATLPWAMTPKNLNKITTGYYGTKKAAKARLPI